MGQVADYLRGYVAGYWAGYDFAVDEPRLSGDDYDDAERVCQGCYEDLTDDHVCAEAGDEGDVEDASASGGASAPTTTPAPGPAISRSALGSPAGAPPHAGPAASVVSSLPAIHQPALAGEGEGVVLAGELERIHAHRGMVLGLRSLAWYFDQLGMAEAKRMTEGMASNVGVEDVT